MLSLKLQTSDLVSSRRFKFKPLTFSKFSTRHNIPVAFMALRNWLNCLRIRIFQILEMRIVTRNLDLVMRKTVKKTPHSAAVQVSD